LLLCGESSRIAKLVALLLAALAEGVLLALVALLLAALAEGVS